MRGSIAEDRGSKNNGRAEATIRSGMGYKMKPSEESGRSAMGTRRGDAQGWELRLGKLQVVVWLGLALGSICGAYCIGFFSGRYVGFETGREVTGVEVAKLPAGDVFPESSTQSQDKIYDKLNSPAVMADGLDAKDAAVARGTGTNQKLPRLLEEKTVGDQALAKGSTVVAARDEQPRSGEASQEDLGNLWGDESSGGELIIGADGETGVTKPSENVRMLGGAKVADVAKGDTKGNASLQEAPKEKSVNALLDERIAKARVENSKDTAAQESSPESSKKSDSASAVRKVLPSGYFAQIAAPKTLNEAEAVAKKLKRSGFPVVVEPTAVAGQSFFRVLVGPEENKVQADRLVSQLKGESYISGTPFIRKVK